MSARAIIYTRIQAWLANSCHIEGPQRSDRIDSNIPESKGLSKCQSLRIATQEKQREEVKEAGINRKETTLNMRRNYCNND